MAFRERTVGANLERKGEAGVEPPSVMLRSLGFTPQAARTSVSVKSAGVLSGSTRLWLGGIHCSCWPSI